MKRTTLVAAATAAAIALGGLTAGVAATSASAASSGSAGSISHPDVTFYKGQRNKAVKVRYTVKKPSTAQIKDAFDHSTYLTGRYDGWGNFYWNLDAENLDGHGNVAGGGGYRYSPAHSTSGSYSERVYSWDGYGKHVTRATIAREFDVYAIDSEGYRETDWYTMKDVTYRDTFYVRRATYLKVNASPEPVKKGRYVTVKGTAKYWNPDANYGSGRIKPLKGKTVKIYFDPAGKKKAVYKGSDKVDSKGVFSRKFRQTTKGTWIAKYAGTTTLTADTAKDYVRVTR